MTVKEVAKIMGVHPKTIKMWINLKKLKAKTTPRGYEISEKQLNDYLGKYGK